MKNLKRIVLTLVMAFAIILPSIVFAETKEVKMVAKYQSGPIPRLFYENTCIDGDAVRLMRKHSNKSVEDLYNLGSNCVEISLSENGIK